MNEQELNRKLAEWAGFRGDWIQPDGHISIWGEGYSSAGKLPDFTQSPDACLKWLVPKLQRQNWNIHIHLIVSKRPKVVIANVCTSYLKTAETLVLALCLAIEKLIDGEPK